MSVAGEGLTEPLLNFRPQAKMQIDSRTLRSRIEIHTPLCYTGSIHHKGVALCFS